MKPIGVFRRTTSVPSILKSKRPLGADSPRTQKFIRFSDVVEFATRGWWHANASGDRGVALIKECGIEGLTGEGPLSFQHMVKDEVPDYESFSTPQARFLSIIQKSESNKLRPSWLGQERKLKRCSYEWKFVRMLAWSRSGTKRHSLTR